jgi:hypothetical protein
MRVSTVASREHDNPGAHVLRLTIGKIGTFGNEHRVAGLRDGQCRGNRQVLKRNAENVSMGRGGREEPKAARECGG